MTAIGLGKDWTMGTVEEWFIIPDVPAEAESFEEPVPSPNETNPPSLVMEECIESATTSQLKVLANGRTPEQQKKREKNNKASRDSRQKKKERFQLLKRQVDQLNKENAELKRKLKMANMRYDLIASRDSPAQYSCVTLAPLTCSLAA